MKPLITDGLVDRCARAMYEASIANAGPHHATFDGLSAYWRRVLATQARACLTEALRPAPTGLPLRTGTPLAKGDVSCKSVRRSRSETSHRKSCD